MKKIRHFNDFDMINTFDKVAISVWFQGCSWRCVGCFNPETWKTTDKFISYDELKQFQELLGDERIKKDISYLGGDPFEMSNRHSLFQLLTYARTFKPEAKQYVWTGYKFEDIQHLPHLDYIDVIVDGQFISSLKVEGKKYGSSNQIVWKKINGEWVKTDE